MGHVSDFSAMNTYNGTDLISMENIFGVQSFEMNESLSPIANSFADEIYPQSCFYGSGGLSIEDRIGYFDDAPMIDLFEGNNFNIDFDESDTSLNNGSLILESDPSTTLVKHDNEIEISTSQLDNEVIRIVPSESENSENGINSIIESTCNKNVVNTVNNFQSVNPDNKTFTFEAVYKTSNSSDAKEKKIPKLVIRRNKESKSSEPKFNVTEISAPMTIADNVKLGRRRNVNTKANSLDVSEKVVGSTRKKKSRHKKKKQSIKLKVPDTNQNFKIKSLSSSPSGYSSAENLFPVKKTVSNLGADNCNTYSFETVNSINENLLDTSSHSSKTVPPSVDIDIFSCNGDDNFTNLNNETNGRENESSFLNMMDAADSFQYAFEDGNILPLPSSLNNRKELNVLVDNGLDHYKIPLDEYIPETSKSWIEDIQSMKVIRSSQENSLSSLTGNEHIKSSLEEQCSVTHGGSSGKGSSALELIDELHAHNQQVFEEIEVSTPELEVELCEPKISIQIDYLETSHQLQLSANNHVSEKSISVTEHVENDMNSQNHMPIIETSSNLSNGTVSSTDSVNHIDTSRPRKISSSSSSITSKSSTSHRCYRKRQSRMSTSSSDSSDGEALYNRRIKYDRSTETYCDEFGREIRPNHRRYYLNFKSHQDSPSNNGSSSSNVSRSKSPKHKLHHRKHHKSRSDSASKKRQYSSSRSRSRGRKHKCEGHHKYRSPSPKHRSRKPHYMDLEENIKANEERRVMYVGDIPVGYTIEQLKERFGRFGPIQDCTIKSKSTSDSSLYIFGFVTFKNRSDACSAIENGNSNPLWPKFDLNFGGRRRFCNGNYTDLDGKVAEAESGWYSHQPLYHQQPLKKDDDDFAELLRQEQKRLGMSKK